MKVGSRWSAITGLTAIAVFGGVSAPMHPAQAQSDQVKSNVRLPLDATVEGPDGKSYQVNGSLHVAFHVHRDNAGGVHVQGHVNGQGVSVSGADGSYRLTGAANLSANVNAPKGAASNFTAVANFGLIGKGQLANYRLHANIHGTVNANDEVTATVANVRLSAK